MIILIYLDNSHSNFNYSTVGINPILTVSTSADRFREFTSDERNTYKMKMLMTTRSPGPR